MRRHVPLDYDDQDWRHDLGSTSGVPVLRTALANFGRPLREMHSLQAGQRNSSLTGKFTLAEKASDRERCARQSKSYNQ